MAGLTKYPPKVPTERHVQDMIWLRALQEKVGQGRKAVAHADKALQKYLKENNKEEAPLPYLLQNHER